MEWNETDIFREWERAIRKVDGEGAQEEINIVNIKLPRNSGHYEFFWNIEATNYREHVVAI